MEILNIKRKERRAPKKAKVSTPHFTFKRMLKAAPTAAPADMPKRKGSAKGFLKIACKVEPDRDKEAPTIKACTTRGSLTFQNMGEPLTISLNVRFTEPSNIEKNNDKTNKMIMKNFFFI